MLFLLLVFFFVFVFTALCVCIGHNLFFIVVRVEYLRCLHSLFRHDVRTTRYSNENVHIFVGRLFSLKRYRSDYCWSSISSSSSSLRLSSFSHRWHLLFHRQMLVASLSSPYRRLVVRFFFFRFFFASFRFVLFYLLRSFHVVLAATCC